MRASGASAAAAVRSAGLATAGEGAAGLGTGDGAVLTAVRHPANIADATAKATKAARARNELMVLSYLNLVE